MGTLPNSKSAQVEFFSDRINLWNDNAATIGLTSEEIAAFLTTRINPAAEALEAARQAREAAKAATLAADDAVALMMDEGRGLVSKIQTTAKTSDNANAVYAAANIPAPQPRTPRGVPEQPVNINAEPTTSGVLNLRWGGTIEGRQWYDVARRVTDADGQISDWQVIGSAGERRFADSTLPAGTTGVQYRVRAASSAGASLWATGITVELTPVPTTPQFTLRSTVGREAA